MSNTIKIKLGYREYDSQNPYTAPVSDFKRQYVINDVADDALTPASIEAAVANFNSKIKDEYTEDSINDFFVADDGGYCTGVIEVISESTHETPISLSGGEG